MPPLESNFPSNILELSSLKKKPYLYFRQVLERNGSAVDASIASLFCDGLLHCNNMGLGGGFFMTIYQKATGKVEILNAREKAPLAATEDMFLGDPELSLYGKKEIDTRWSKKY